jgi:hypothetical protein
VPDLPAGRFAAWATAWLSDRCSFDEALDALTGEAAHPVTGMPGTDGAVPLGQALAALRGRGERRFALVLPVPGDVRGLPRVPGLTELALEAGEAAVGATLALVPQPLGSEVITWTAFDLAGALPAPPVEGTLRAASGALDLAVGDAARTLAGLDLARWHRAARRGPSRPRARRSPATRTGSRRGRTGRRPPRTRGPRSAPASGR